MANVLVIGSDRRCSDAVRAILRQDGHDVSCTNGVAGWQAVETDLRPELVVATVSSPADVLIDQSDDGSHEFPAPLLFVLEGPRPSEHPFMDDRLVDRIVTPYLDEELLGRVDALVRVRRVVESTPLSPDGPGSGRAEQRSLRVRLRRAGRRVASVLRTHLPRREKPYDAYLEVATRVAHWADRRDAYTPGHAERVTCFCAMMAEALGFEDHETGSLLRAAMLHDIGKVAVPVEILHRKGPLPEAQMQMIRTHPRRGAALIRELDPDDDVADTILCHHERPDGFGYYGMDGDRIPRSARALAVAEVYDGMTTSRALERLSGEQAVDRMASFKGVSLDTDCVEALVDRLEPASRTVLVSTGPAAPSALRSS
jgi:putative nucleotidyltransferase with HDIG domain